MKEDERWINMFIEIDDGVIVNLYNTFKIKYKSYNNRGVWYFYGSGTSGKEDITGENIAVSRQFNSEEDARKWLREIFFNFKELSAYFEGSKTKMAKPKNLEIIDELK